MLINVTPGWWSEELFSRFADGDESPEVMAFAARWRRLTAALNRRSRGEGFDRVHTERSGVSIEVPDAAPDDARRTRVRALAEAVS